MLNSEKKPVRFLARLNESDLRTVLGKSLRKLLEQTGMEDKNPSSLSPVAVKRSVVYMPVPTEEEWRVSVCQDLLNARSQDVHLPGFSCEEIDAMLAYTCVS